jgi:tubulin epsilon
MGYGPKYREELIEKIRRPVEFCESLQSFLLLHSLGGGTGSGLGTFILELLEDQFPNAYRFVSPVFPSEKDDVITSPYNRFCLIFLLI